MSKGVFGTDDEKHPGVARVNQMADTLVSGKIHLVQKPSDVPIRKYRMTPVMTLRHLQKLDGRVLQRFKLETLHTLHMKCFKRQLLPHEMAYL